jgi:hypothetical protein
LYSFVLKDSSPMMNDETRASICDCPSVLCAFGASYMVTTGAICSGGSYQDFHSPIHCTGKTGTLSKSDASFYDFLTTCLKVSKC